MFCYKCGFKIDDQFHFCPNCGADLSIINTSSNQTPQLQKIKYKEIKRPPFFITDLPQEGSPIKQNDHEKVEHKDQITINSWEEVTEDFRELIVQNAVDELIININGSFIDPQTKTNRLFPPSLKAIDFKITLSPEVTDLSGLFFGCFMLSHIKHKINLSHVQKIEDLFFNCYNLKCIPLINFDHLTNIKDELKPIAFNYTESELNTVDLETANILLKYEILTKAQLQNNADFQQQEANLQKEKQERLNPILNKPSDLTESLLELIATNQLESLTLNSDFFQSENCNPFHMIRERLKQISFTIKFGPTVTSAQSLFAGCFLLQEAPKMILNNVNDLSFLFKDCRALRSANNFLSIRTTKVTNMTGMFKGCSALREVPLFDTSNVTNMNYMFQDCSALVFIPNYRIDHMLSNVNMLQGCSMLENTDYSNNSYNPHNNKISVMDAYFTGLKSIN